MGYHSCVGLCLTGEGLGWIQNKVKVSLSKSQNDLTTLFGEAEFSKTEEGCHTWYWEGFKWNRSETDIAFLEESLSDLDWDQYLFIRIGENLDDVEYQGGFWDNPFGMRLTRGIGFHEE